MRRFLLLAPVIMLSACHRVGSNPWLDVDYAEMNCGSKEAILTTTGCLNAPPAKHPIAQVRSPRGPNNTSESDINELRHNEERVQGTEPSPVYEDTPAPALAVPAIAPAIGPATSQTPGLTPND